MPGHADSKTGRSYRTLIPARIDRLRWTPFHTRMVVALGIAWALDGLEITIAAAAAGVLTLPSTLGLSPTEVGLMATVYLLGEVVGALVFGRLSDALGRRNLFIFTLGVYLARNALTALTWGNGTGRSPFSMRRVSSPACASAENTPRSIRQSTRWSPPDIAAASTSR